MRSPSRPRRRLARAIALAAVAGARLLGAQQPVDTALGRITFHVTESLADSTGRTRILLVAQAEKPDRCGLPLRARVASHGDTIVVDRWSQAPVMPPRRSGSRW